MNKNSFHKDERSWKRANDLLIMALNSEGQARNILARKAINTNQDYIDAYVFLGDEASSSFEREEWYRMAVRVGKRVLGDEFFQKHQGNFWQFPKARSFLDGLQGLADELYYQNREEEALTYYRELLRLNNTDEHGVRHNVFKILVSRKHYQEARELLKQYTNDTSPSWLYNDVLLSYLVNGKTKETEEKLKRALASNSLICQLLLNPPHLAALEDNEFRLICDEVECVEYVHSMAYLWTEESGILDWMKQIYEHQLNSKLKPPRSGEKALFLASEGRALLVQNEIVQAEQLFSLALEYQEDMYIRNDLAYCKLVLEKYQEAIDVLQPVIANDFINPFGNIIAAEAAYHLGDQINTRRFIKQAVDQFEEGIKSSFLGHDLTPNWQQLTLVIKDVAGMAGEHRLVISLFNRWKQYLAHDEDIFQVGVAHFNLGQYQAAIKYWEKIEQNEQWSLLKDYIEGAKILQRISVPAFELEYLTPFHLMTTYQLSEHALGETFEELGVVKLLLIAKLFKDVPAENQQQIQAILILTTLDKWGIDFAKQILTSKDYPYSWKVATLFCLVSKGYFNYGDQVSLIIDGRSQTIQITEQLFEQEFLKGEPETLSLNYLLSLFKRNQYAKIVELSENKLSFQAEQYLMMHMIAAAYYQVGQQEKAYQIADWYFTQMIQDQTDCQDDLLLLNAGLWALLGDKTRCFYCLASLSQMELDPELQNLYFLLLDRNDKE